MMPPLCMTVWHKERFGRTLSGTLALSHGALSRCGGTDYTWKEPLGRYATVELSKAMEQVTSQPYNPITLESPPDSFNSNPG